MKTSSSKPPHLTIVVLYITLNIVLKYIKMFGWSILFPFIKLFGYSSVPDDYPLVLGCEEHVSSLGVFVA